MTAEFLGLSPEECELIHIAGHLHDIGKIGVPDYVLLKSGALTNDEFTKIKEHTTTGYNIVKNIPGLEEISKIVLHHHEHYDGKGYPQMLAGNQIPLGARILAVADSYDAMTTNRPYREKMSHFEALERIEAVRGTQFDPVITDAFLAGINSHALEKIAVGCN